jgi:electron transfer flavoprotein alpha subunit
MAVLVFAESLNGTFKKTAYEAVYYGAQTAKALGTECVALTLGEVANAGILGTYGASKVFNYNSDRVVHFDSQVYTSAIVQTAQEVGADVIVLSHSSNGKALVGRIAARMDAGSVPGASAVPEVVDGNLQVKKNVFSGKAYAYLSIKSANKVISVMGNSLQPIAEGAETAVESIDLDLPAPRITVKEVKRVEGKTPLPEAELVVSAGRGMKGPENWGIIEDLADALGATTACSRPVADTDWRPHHEHVGQTGIAIRPNLYIAAGISGAIQHLAGVNNSKVIVVINKDPEAPFFKAADYGVVGDLFEVVPRLTEAVKKLKG